MMLCLIFQYGCVIIGFDNRLIFLAFFQTAEYLLRVPNENVVRLFGILSRNFSGVSSFYKRISLKYTCQYCPISFKLVIMIPVMVMCNVKIAATLLIHMTIMNNVKRDVSLESSFNIKVCLY